MAYMTAPTQAGGSRPADRPPPSRTARTTYRSVFAVGEFRVLFAAMLMYVLGFEFEILGLSVIVFAQTRSPFLTALAFSMGFAPQAVGGALFSSLADRLPTRLVIGAGLLTRAVPGLVIGLVPVMPVPAMLAVVGRACGPGEPARAASRRAGSCGRPWPATSSCSGTAPCAACCSRSGCPYGSFAGPSR